GAGARARVRGGGARGGGQRSGAVGDLVRTALVVGEPGADRAQVLRGAVVAQHGLVEVGGDGQIAVVGAEVAAGGERRVVDVVGVLAAVAVGVLTPGGPGRGDELHRADRAVVDRVAV